ncbi:PIR Superfamily Protein [Plasmodium ovale wallikeri]|uniref:PIR Superfamily Protein n=1 Tax=Plasmodium ovale wallikeri TaxID=864142 RepID=A0A1A9AK96_PLAOA|nr:PIR Superfamily Protein [Plasmodium ovale wallikeri]SBT56926.1 PIR Superfamily Protein [Plasmodium ovale wallikeri]
MITKCNEGSELPSCKIYELFNKGNGASDTFDFECHNLQRMFQYEGIFDLCIKLSGNLVNLCDDSEKKIPLNYNSEFLHHWLFSKIINNLDITDHSECIGMISRFYVTWENVVKSLSCETKCKPNSILFHGFTTENLIFRKEMHDYIYNYSYFDEITFVRGERDNEYCRYLPSMRDKYAQIKEKCPLNTAICFKVDKPLEKYNPENLCEKLQCRNEDLCKKYFERTPEQRESDGNGSLEGVKGADPRDSEAVTTGEESETSTILTTVGPSLLGLFMTSFILFKLTPIRSWLNNQMLKNRKVEEYMDEQSRNELLNDYFIHEDTGSEEKGYGIAYHSA